MDARYGRICLAKEPVEIVITSFREDGPYLDRRHPSWVKFIDSADLDAQRRDYTINAIYQGLPGGAIRDPFSGLADLGAGLLRVIGDPEVRLREDPLRVLRGLKFAARLDLEIEASCAAAMRGAADLVAELQPSRYYAELEPMLSGPGRARAVLMLDEFSLLPGTLAELIASSGVDLQAIAHSLDTLPPGRPALSWASLLQPLAGPAVVDAQLKALAAPRRLRAEVLALCRAQEKLAEGEWFSCQDSAEDHVQLLQARTGIPEMRVAAARELKRLNTMQRLGKLITGDDLIAMDVPPGPMRREILGELLRACEGDEILDRDTAQERLRVLVRARIKAPSPQVDKKRRGQ